MMPPTFVDMNPSATAVARLVWPAELFGTQLTKHGAAE